MAIPGIHIENREILVEQLIGELHGPRFTLGKPLKITQVINFSSWDESRGPWIDEATEQEILSDLTPGQQYGIGVLVPAGSSSDDASESIQKALDISNEEDIPIDAATQNSLLTDAEAVERSPDVDEGVEEFHSAGSTVQFRQQSSLGVSFLINPTETISLTFEITGARYEHFFPRINNVEREWWVRIPIREQVQILVPMDAAVNAHKQSFQYASSDGAKTLTLDFQVHAREYRQSGNLILTATLTNRTKDGARDRSSLFQAKIRCHVGDPDKGRILPYPIANTVALDEDEHSANLLYRSVAPFAIGHGCAANWQANSELLGAASVETDCIPSVQLPPVSADVKRSDGTPFSIEMASLARESANNHSELRELVTTYRDWIAKLRSEQDALPSDVFRSTAAQHLTVCEKYADRMDDGIRFLETNRQAAEAFRLANKSMQMQRLRTSGKRQQVPNDKEGRLEFSPPFRSLETRLEAASPAVWRAFQIGFMLANLKSVVLPDDAERETVDLLWFPTGGGKTEAYLGLSAFAIFFRRLNNPSDYGTTVLMRYTLRLLTAQQFQRASALICAMELIRRQNQNSLGSKPITIGMWVGGGSTPNRNSQAQDLLKKIGKGDSNLDSSFILDACPWCGADMLPEKQGTKHRSGNRTGSLYRFGYFEDGASVTARCTDSFCDFRQGLPITVIDDVLYENPPEFLLGTVDKFAQLAWRNDARSLFGRDESGSQVRTPPSLIIQDELHLISGPLGSVAGGYEPVIQDLCTDHRSTTPVLPKIIASTATIRGYREHVDALFGRSSQLFPPPGLDASDSFFARTATDEHGKPLPGKKYLGILAPGYRSHQNAIARVVGTTHQLVHRLEGDESAKDPWWTNLMFFGSLRELGNSLTLIAAGVPTFVRLTGRRYGSAGKGALRFVNNSIELTGRISGSEVPKRLDAITRAYPGNQGHGKAVDICLATNIIEVGVDVDRLSLMTVIGQPKSMASYIQATGRVGRLWHERPGLVLTVFSPTRARDRSYYEQFRSVHERLYSQVEPTTLTPFSVPALKRTLHGAMIAHIRQTGPEKTEPTPVPIDGIEAVREIYEQRLESSSEELRANFSQVFDQRVLEWKSRLPIHWRAEEREEKGLAYGAGDFVSPRIEQQAWAVLTSMRNVDAECRIATPWDMPSTQEED